MLKRKPHIVYTRGRWYCYRRFDFADVWDGISPYKAYWNWYSYSGGYTRA